jgi:hypothetical protein
MSAVDKPIQEREFLLMKFNSLALSILCLLSFSTQIHAAEKSQPPKGGAVVKRKPAQAVEQLSAEEIKLVQKMRQTYRSEEGQNASPELRDRMQSEVGYENEAQRSADIQHIEENLHRLSDKKARQLRQALDKLLR